MRYQRSIAIVLYALAAICLLACNSNNWETKTVRKQGATFARKAPAVGTVRHGKNAMSVWLVEPNGEPSKDEEDIKTVVKNTRLEVVELDPALPTVAHKIKVSYPELIDEIKAFKTLSKAVSSDKTYTISSGKDGFKAEDETGNDVSPDEAEVLKKDTRMLFEPYPFVYFEEVVVPSNVFISMGQKLDFSNKLSGMRWMDDDKIWKGKAVMVFKEVKEINGFKSGVFDIAISLVSLETPASMDFKVKETGFDFKGTVAIAVDSSWLLQARISAKLWVNEPNPNDTSAAKPEALVRKPLGEGHMLLDYTYEE